MGEEYRTIKVAPMSLHMGAEITGVDLKAPLSEETIREIREAWVRWKVVFFRGQHLDHAQHVAFARLFGEPTIGHAVFGHGKDSPRSTRWPSSVKTTSTTTTSRC